MNLNIDKILKIAGAASAILVLLFGISLATVRERIILMVKSPAKVVILESEVDELKRAVHHSIDVNEMTWELARLMTDNNDSTDFYYIASDNGVVYEVDIRETAEGAKLAFVAKLFIVYPVYTGPNGRKYVMLHDSREQNTYLYKQQ